MNMPMNMDDTRRIQYASYLKTLAICHYIWGGLICFFGLIGLMYVVIGLGMAALPAEAFENAAANDPNAPSPEQAQAAMRTLGTIMAIIGCGTVAFAEVVGVLVIISGRKIAQRTGRTFSIVMAAISCLSVPIGTVLGVFTIVVLTNDTAKTLYAEAAAGDASTV